MLPPPGSRVVYEVWSPDRGQSQGVTSDHWRLWPGARVRERATGGEAALARRGAFTVTEREQGRLFE